MRKGGDDETEGEAKECRVRMNDEERGKDKREKNKKGEASLKIASRQERRVREKKLTVVVVATSPGSGRWLKNEVI